MIQCVRCGRIHQLQAVRCANCGASLVNQRITEEEQRAYARQEAGEQLRWELKHPRTRAGALTGAGCGLVAGLLYNPAYALLLVPAGAVFGAICGLVIAWQRRGQLTATVVFGLGSMVLFTCIAGFAPFGFLSCACLGAVMGVVIRFRALDG